MQSNAIEIARTSLVLLRVKDLRLQAQSSPSDTVIEWRFAVASKSAKTEDDCDWLGQRVERLSGRMQMSSPREGSQHDDENDQRNKQRTSSREL